MDAELLVKELTAERIEVGSRFLAGLVRDGVDVVVAAWVRYAERGWWTFTIAAGRLDPQSAEAYDIVYPRLDQNPRLEVGPADLHLLRLADPRVQELAAIRDRYPGGRLPTRYRGAKLGGHAIEEAYIYPRITAELTRDEVIQAVTGLMDRRGAAPPSTLTLRDGGVIRGFPYGLEVGASAGRAELQVKIRDESNAPRVVAVDDVANIQ